MAVHNYTIRLAPPDSYRRVVTWKADGEAVNLSGYSVSWTITGGETEFEWTEDDPEVVVDSEEGEITLTIFDTVALADVEAGFHSLVVTDGTGFKTTLLDGRVTSNG